MKDPQHCISTEERTARGMYAEVFFFCLFVVVWGVIIIIGRWLCQCN